VCLVTQQDPRVAAAVAAGRSPFRRRVDDVEAAIMTGLLVFFLAVAPVLGFVTGHLTDSASIRQQRAEQSWRPATAVLDQSAAEGLIGLDGEWGASWVIASWPRPDGAVQTGLVAVALNARDGQHVRIWETRTGQLTHPPLTSGDIRDRVVSAVIATVAALAVLLAIVAGVVRVIAGRRRLAGWARAWAAVAPHWSPHR
jgi:hypothetical protein